MSQKFKSDIETQAGLIDSFGFSGSAGQILSSTGTKTEWITPPQSPGGGGSSQVFYFNGGTASSVGGYYQMSPVANTSTAVDFTINANGYIASFLTDVNSPNQLNIPAGNWNFEIYFSASSGGGSPSFYVELYKYSSSTFTLIASGSASPEGITNGTAIDAYFTPLAVPATTLLATDRLAVRVYVTHSGRTITMHTQNGHLSDVITTFSTGLTALNGLTEQVQYFATGAGGTDFNIASAVNTHTFNLPTASATNRGALSSADWTTFNSKANASGTTNYVSKFTGTTSLGDSQIFDNGTNVGLGTTTPGAKLDVSSGNINLSNSFNLTARNNANTFNIALIGRSSTDRVIIDADGYGTNIGGGGTVLINPSGGNVGIGTSSPQNKLQIGTMLGYSTNAFAIGNGSIDFAIYQDTSLTQLYTSGGFLFATNSTERMRITSAGNVGIGTSNPLAKLHVAGSLRNSFASGSGGDVYMNIIDGVSNGFRTVVTTSNQINYTFHNGSNQEVLSILNSGNVGIGTSSPQAKLHINNGTDRNLWFRVNGSGTGTELLSINDAQSTRQSLAFSASSFYFDNGNVGIGTTSPTSPLHIVKSGGARINLGDSQNTVAISSIEEVGDSAIGFYTQTSIERMRISSGGNVGIGTSSPNRLLTVAGTTSGLIALNASSYRNTTIGSDSVGNFIVYDDTAGAYRMVINSGGNVGIGTSSPSTKLEVSGRTLVNEFQYTKAINISSANLNDYTFAGFYNGESMTNAPNSGWFWVTVERYSGDDNWAHQTATSFGSNNTANIIYSRTKTGGTWTAWKQLTTSSDISGTTNYVSKFTGANSLGNSLIYDNGTNVGIGTTSPTQKVQIGDGTGTGSQYLRISSSASEIYIGQSGGTILGLAGNSAQLILGDHLNFPLAIGTTNAQPLVFGTTNNERMRITDAGNVGIGTSSPGEKLSVKSADAAIKLEGSTNSYLFQIVDSNNRLRIFDNTNNAERITLTSAGNVGIGTTSPSSLLSVAGNATFGQGANRPVTYDSNGGNFRITANTGGWAMGYYFNGSSGTYRGGFGAYGGADDLGWYFIGSDYNASTATYFLPNGNVGVGTTSPNKQLTFAQDDDDAIQIRRFTTSQGNPSIGTGISWTWADASTNNETWAAIRVIMPGSGNSNMTFSTTPSGGASGLAERMRITDTGNVGIGTSSPTSKLHLQGTNTNITITDTTYNRTSNIGYIDNANLYLANDSSSNTYIGRYNNVFLAYGGGNVGIGTSSPGYKLEVNGGNLGSSAYSYVPTEMLFANNGNGEYFEMGSIRTSAGSDWTTAGFRIQERIDSTWMAYMQFNGDGNLGGMSFGTGTSATSRQSISERMRILSNGNVGIGTSSPAAKLDVNGDALINNVTIGRGPGNISTNTALGTGALDSTTTANYNIAVGWGANTNNNANGLTAIGVDLNVGPDTGNLGQDCLAIAQFNSNADTAQVPHIYAPKPISIGGGATNIITFDLLHYAGAIVEYLIRYDDGGDYAVGTVYMGWKTSGSGNMIDKRQIEWNNMSGFVFSLGGSGQTLVLTNTSGNNAWVRITVRGMMTN